MKKSKKLPSAGFSREHTINEQRAAKGLPPLAMEEPAPVKVEPKRNTLIKEKK